MEKNNYIFKSNEKYIEKILIKINSYFSLDNKIKKSSIFNTLCIDGKYGTGKSTAMNDIEYYINNKYNLISFEKINLYTLGNLIENDTNIFLSNIFLKISNKFKNSNEIEAEINKLATKNFKLKSINLISEFIPFFKKIQNIKSENEKINKEIDEKYIKNIESDIYNNNSIISIINKINKLTENKKIIIAFDDLDRCSDFNLKKIISALSNFIFLLKNIFFILPFNIIRVNNILNNCKNYNEKNDEKFTDKFIYETINIEKINPFNLKKELLEINNESINEFIKLNKNKINKRQWNNIIEKYKRDIIKYKFKKNKIFWETLLFILIFFIFIDKNIYNLFLNKNSDKNIKTKYINYLNEKNIILTHYDKYNKYSKFKVINPFEREEDIYSPILSAYQITENNKFLFKLYDSKNNKYPFDVFFNEINYTNILSQFKEKPKETKFYGFFLNDGDVEKTNIIKNFECNYNSKTIKNIQLDIKINEIKNTSDHFDLLNSYEIKEIFDNNLEI